MDNLIKYRISFTDVAHETNTDHDTSFYRTLPGADYSYSGTPIPGPPEQKNTIVAIVTGILSSTVLATTIQTWVTKHPTTIEVSIEKDKKSIKFEGPDFPGSKEDIQFLIDELTKGKQDTVVIRAIPHPEKKTNRRQ